MTHLESRQVFHQLDANPGSIAIKPGWKSFLQNGLNWLGLSETDRQWLLISTVGCLMMGLGVAFWIQPLAIYQLMYFLLNALESMTETVARYPSGLLVLTVGSALVLRGHPRSASEIRNSPKPSRTTPSVIQLPHQSQFQGAKIVAIGGGTGLSALLRGLKHYSSDITAIVTVADDGGSSGRLRREYGILPLGDIRNCMTALADEEETITELFRFRFQQGEGLAGHSFGNLFLAAMNSMTGDLEQAITACSQILKIKGQVLPATLCDVHLWAELSDGRRIEGESHITEAKGQIHQIGCTPANPPALPAVIAAIESADYIILGPGSLYTSVIPNLLVPEIRQAIARATVPRIYICNIMTQPGETDGYRVSDHIRALDRVCGQRLFDYILVHQGNIASQSLAAYAEEGAYPVVFDRQNVSQLNCQVIIDNVLEIDSHNYSIGHHSHRLARSLERALSRQLR